ncbi:MAG: hypothetical protein APF84_14440 [Gracilibacter sp. BRH_c7a]|nr:MAG: hypothetical protein APF84_14440 [Gracilibacter sp. BRH_c7a]
MSAGTEVVVKTNVEKNTDKTFLMAIGVVFLVGLGFWIKQIMGGFSGYSAQYAWGLYIAAFFTAVAGGAGVMILAAITNIMNIIDERKSRQFYMAAVAMFVMAGFFILADLGAPLNIFKLVFTTNMSAPMVLDFWLLMACVVICIISVFLKGQSKNLSIVGLVLAFVLLVVEAWLIASGNAQQLWGITMGGGIAFIQVAIMSFSLLMLIGQDAKYVKLGLVFGLLIFLGVSLTDLLAGLSDGGRLGLQWAAVANSYVFWIGIVVGAIAPLVLLLKAKELVKNSRIVISALAMLGVLFTKLSYVWSSQAVPAIDIGANSAAGFHLEEIIVVIGFTALGILVYYGLNARKGGA